MSGAGIGSMGLPHHHCERCGHDWVPRRDEKPNLCPKCKSYVWYKKKKGKKDA